MSQQAMTIEERYALLKQEFDEIDKKYNRALNDIELDFPPTLGLTKLTFTPADQQALQDMAQDYYSAQYDQDLAEFVQSNMQKQNQQSYKLTQEKADYTQNCQSLQDKYNQKRLDFINKAFKNCLTQSSIYQQELQRLLDEYNVQVEDATKRYQQAVAHLNQSLQLLQDLMSQASINIQQQKQAKVAEKLFQLNENEQRKSDNVTKYNNTVDKQEVDHKVKIEKAYATVTSAEQQRALEAINLLATVGVTGVEALKAEEKVSIAKDFFATLNRQQAQTLFYGDNTLQYHFASYYAYMQEYVESLPL